MRDEPGIKRARASPYPGLRWGKDCGVTPRIEQSNPGDASTSGPHHQSVPEHTSECK